MLLRIATRTTIDNFVDNITFACPSVDQDINSPNFGTQVLKGMVKTCVHCNAMKFACETKSFCCADGKVQIPHLPPMPQQLMNLWNENAAYLKNIRKYNQVMAFCSLVIK